MNKSSKPLLNNSTDNIIKSKEEMTLENKCDKVEKFKSVEVLRKKSDGITSVFRQGDENLFFVHNEVSRQTPDPQISEWDDDNVIVIDLTEDRSAVTSAYSQSGELDLTTETFESDDEIQNDDDDEIENSLDSSLLSQTFNNKDKTKSQLQSSPDGRNSCDASIPLEQRFSSNQAPAPVPTERQVFSSEIVPNLDTKLEHARASSSMSSNSSVISQVSPLDHDFHCKGLVLALSKNANTTKSQQKTLFHNYTGDKVMMPYSRGKKPKMLASKTKSISVDNKTVSGVIEDNNTRPCDTLHQEIIQSSKQTVNDSSSYKDIAENGLKNKECQESVTLAPVKVRPWERKISKNEFLGGREVTYIRPRHQAFFGNGDGGDISSPDCHTPMLQHNSESAALSRSALTPLSAKNVHNRINGSASKSFSSSHGGTGPAPLSIFSARVHSSCREHSAPGDPFLRRSLDRAVYPLNIDRCVLLGHQDPGRGRNHDLHFSALKAPSSEFLDQLDNSVSSRGQTHSSAGVMSLSRGGMTSDKMTRIDKNLFLGSIEAATDVILLGCNEITHVVSIDSVPLPRKISAMMPRISFMHMQISDLPEEDLLSHLGEAIAFIDSALVHGGAVLVHCFRGRSRSATVVIAYLMYKHHYKLEKAFLKVKSKRNCINPHISFLAQLKLFEAMDYTIDHNNIQYKMFRLFCASERMRKAKVLFRDSLDKVLDVDPAGGLPGSAEAAEAAAAKSRYPMIYKCRKCRRTLATAFNMLPHVRGESPNWTDEKWARLSEEDVLDDISNPAGLELCSQSVFITPVGWMENEIKHNLSGRLYCPNCQVRVGNYSWVMGDLCKGCGASVLPAFQLDITEIIFRTHNRYLQSGYVARGPILV